MLQVSNWLFVSANSKTRVERPKPLPRPGVNEPDNPDRLGSGSYTTTDMRALLDRWAAGTEPTERT